MGRYDERRRRVADALVTAGLDALLVTAPENIRYVTGFTGSNGAVLLTPDDTLLATDGRYDEQARRETGLAGITVTRDLLAALVSGARRAGAAVIGIERDHVTLAAFDDIAAAADGLTVTAVAGLVERARMVKGADELATLTEACRIADEAFAEVLATARPGTTEREVADALERAMRRRGAEAIAFATIVAAGPNGSEPHHQPTGYAFADGDLVTVDMGARLDGYHSDMTRTVAIGAPRDWQCEIHALVTAAQAAGRAAVRAGAEVAAPDRAARSVIDAAGHAEHFVHGVGHGVGLEIHEAPMLFGSAGGLLEAGMVVTVEPGVYLPGRGGVRVEDTVIVTPDGNRPITLASYELSPF